VRSGALLALALLAAAPAAAHAAGSAEVAALQVALRGAGFYDNTIDGVAGAGTRTAVRRFQERKGLGVDGVAGDATREALGRRGRPAYGSRTIRRGDSGWDVAALQFRLAWHGFPSGSIDGGYGSHAEAAVRRFQAHAGLTPDGTAGPRTLRLLRGAIPRSPIWLKHPVGGRIGDRFGPRGNRFHTGLDYPAASGTVVAAAGRGTVVFSGWDTGGYGNTVVIEHPLGVRSLYAHLSRIGVNKGSSVSAGERAGRMMVRASTIASSWPRLRFMACARPRAWRPGRP